MSKETLFVISTCMVEKTQDTQKERLEVRVDIGILEGYFVHCPF